MLESELSEEFELSPEGFSGGVPPLPDGADPLSPSGFAGGVLVLFVLLVEFDAIVVDVAVSEVLDVSVVLVDSVVVDVAAYAVIGIAIAVVPIPVITPASIIASIAFFLFIVFSTFLWLFLNFMR